MTNRDPKRDFAGAEFLYRLLLFAYPSEFRRTNGREMLQLFRDHCHEECLRRQRPGVVFLAQSFWDAVVNAALIRLNGQVVRNAGQDVRIAFRGFARKPGFAAVVVLTLGLGIGANTAVFSIVHSVLLRPLPFADSERLIAMRSRDESPGAGYYLSYPDFQDLRNQSRSFDQIAAARSGGYTLTGKGGADRIPGARVSANFFSMLSVNPILGRTFRASEDAPGSEPTVLMSYSLWQRRFAGDPGVVGQTLTLNGRSTTVIGILPKDFQFPLEVTIAELWGTTAFEGPALSDRKSRNNLAAFGRLAPGASAAGARSEVDTIARRLAQQYPDSNAMRGIDVVSLQDQVVGGVRPALLVLLAAVGFVLLISCSNVVNLLLARASVRRKEIAIRAALGADRGRIIRQLLTENLLLALLGGGLGVLFARWLIQTIIATSPGSTIPRLQEVGIDSRVLLFTASISLLAGAVLSAASGWQTLGSDLHGVLKEGMGSRRRHVLRQALVVSEVAIAIVLLAGAGLLIRSFSHLLHADLGFNPNNVLKVTLSLPADRYPDEKHRTGFIARALERIETLPGVEAAAVANVTPMSGYDSNLDFSIEGRNVAQSESQPNAEYRAASAGYFKTMAMRALRGRVFGEQEFKEGRAVVINAAMAHTYWPGMDAIGKNILIPKVDGRWHEIIGVVANVRHSGVDIEPRPEMYVPTLNVPNGTYDFVFRSSLSPEALTGAVRAEFKQLDPDLPLFTIRTLDETVARGLARQRFSMVVLSAFAVLALILAAVGIYGVMSQVAADRRREIGLRLALGALRGDLLKMVLGEAMKLVLAGAALGLVAALVLVRAMSGLISGITPHDPATFAAVALVLITVALGASYLPARRAATADPVASLRFE